MAERQLRSLNARTPSKPLYATFLQRVAHLRANPPGAASDGTTAFETKSGPAMQLRILGCSGGIGGGLRTTSMLVDHDVLIDAGTGVGDLSLTELKQIDHIFVTHSHLDHVVSIPFLVDTVGGMRDSPITVHATEETLDILRKHLFNWKIWPDFAEIPNRERPYLRYESLRLGDTVTLGGRRIRSLPANHVVPAVGYRLDSGAGSLVFTGDTTTNDGPVERGQPDREPCAI